MKQYAGIDEKVEPQLKITPDMLLCAKPIGDCR